MSHHESVLKLIGELTAERDQARNQAQTLDGICKNFSEQCVELLRGQPEFDAGKSIFTMLAAHVARLRREGEEAQRAREELEERVERVKALADTLSREKESMRARLLDLEVQAQRAGNGHAPVNVAVVEADSVCGDRFSE